MLCKIADLIAEIPAADGLDVRCREYLYDGESAPDITVYRELYRWERFHPDTKPETVAYMEAAAQFCRQLIGYDGLYLHASAVVRDGKAYLFSGNRRAGKSTHTQLWLDTFGGDTRIINDDKPALRCMNGVWYAYGTPWCGKDGINRNERAPLAGICFLEKAPHNRIRRMGSAEALPELLRQTMHRLDDARYTRELLRHLDDLLAKIPVYVLENRPEASAAQLSYKTMRQGCREDHL